MHIDLFSPAKPRTYTTQAKEQILELVRLGHLGPGDKLPSERDLSNRLGISRTCVREAIQALAMAGIVDIQPGRGAFVLTGNPDAMIAQTIKQNGLQKDKLLELNELRRAIEVEAAALAAARATDKDLAKMRKHLQEIETRLKTGESAAEADVAFHLAVVSASHNQLIKRVMESVTNLLTKSFRETQRVEDREYILTGHQDIYAEIERHDVEGARRIMRYHLDRSLRLIEVAQE